MNLAIDVNGFPVMPAGKMEQLYSLIDRWGQFWFDRREQRAEEWGPFEDWSELYPDAGGPALAQCFWDPFRSEYQSEWVSLVARGSVEHPLSLGYWEGWLPGQWTYIILAAAGATAVFPNTIQPAHLIGARWLVFAWYQTKVAECIFNISNYTPRPGAGRHAVD